MKPQPEIVRRVRRRRHRLSRAVLWLALVLIALSLSGRWWVQTDSINIVAHVWWPLLLIAVGLAIWRLGRRAWPLSAAALVATLGSGAVLFAPIMKSAVAGEPAHTRKSRMLRVVSYNLFKDNDRFALDRAWLIRQNADIVVLLEAQRMVRDDGAPLHALYPHRVDCSPHWDCSTAVFSQFPILKAEQLAGDGDAENREALSAVSVTLDVEGMPLTVVAVHRMHPWPLGDQQQWRPLLETAALDTADAAVLVGDFNNVPSTFAMQSLTEATGYTLASPMTATWPASIPAPLRLPLDQMWIKGPLVAESIETGPRGGSDHLPLVAELELRK